MQPTVSGVPTSSTGRELSSTSSGLSGLDLLIQAASFCCQESRPDDAMADRSHVRRTAISDFDIMWASEPETVIASNKNKRDKTGNIGGESISTTGNLSNRRKQPFECEICKRTFTRYESLKLHHQTMHDANPARFSCEQCTASFSRPNTLRQHMQKEHGTILSFRCHICQQGICEKTLVIQTRNDTY